jgi:hypothetical protein
VEELTDQERGVLVFEAQGWPSVGEKATCVHAAWGWSLTHYEQTLQHIIDLPAAVVFDPVLVNRLRRLRDQRRRARSARRLNA